MTRRPIPAAGTRVQAYRNLHRKCWSLRDPHTRRVIGHADFILLKECVFKVSEAGRQRVLREKRKNVHAVIEGTLSHGKKFAHPGWGDVRYNPYRAGTFTQEDRSITTARYVVLFASGTVQAIGG